MKDCPDCQQLKKFAYYSWKANKMTAKIPLASFFVRKMIKDLWMAKIFTMGINYNKELEKEKHARASQSASKANLS